MTKFLTFLVLSFASALSFADGQTYSGDSQSTQQSTDNHSPATTPTGNCTTMTIAKTSLHESSSGKGDGYSHDAEYQHQYDASHSDSEHASATSKVVACDAVVLSRGKLVEVKAK